MLDYDEAWAEQLDIESLATPMDSPGLDRYGPNEHYGCAIILKAYAGYDVARPLEAIVPHGVYLADEVPPSELDVHFQCALTYPEYLDAPWRRAGKTVIPVAAPFLYAREFMRDRGILRDDFEREGTLFVPSHSTRSVRAVADYAEIAARLVELPDHMQPVTVCVYWYDYLQGMYEPFEDLGLPIVCAGSLKDPAFQVRLIHLISRFKYVGANAVGSQLPYASAVGAEPFLIPASGHVELAEGFETPDISADRAQEIEQLEALYQRLDGEALKEKLMASNVLLRVDQLKEPDGLLCDLEYAARLARGSRRA